MAHSLHRATLPTSQSSSACLHNRFQSLGLHVSRTRRAPPHLQPTLAAAPTGKNVQRVQEASQPQTDNNRSGGRLLTWQQIGEEAGPDTLAGYQLLDHSPQEGQPRTAPTTVLATEESTTTDKPVLLYRDTNAWCPFCERVRARTYALGA